MLKNLFLLSLFSLQVFSMADWGYPEIDDIVILNPQNHDEFLEKYEEVFIYYYLPDCKYCILLEKFLPDLALEFKETEKRVPFASLNCNRHMSYCDGHAIPTFPFLKFYIRKHPLTYMGARTKNDIKYYIEDKLYLEPLELNEDSFFTLMDRTKNIGIFHAFYFGKKKSKLYHIFDLNFKYHQEIDFYFIESPKDLKRYIKSGIFEDSVLQKSKLKSNIFMIKDDKSYHFNNKPTFDNLDKFIFNLKHPNIITLNKNFYKVVANGPEQFFVLFVNSMEDPNIPEFEKFAKDNRREMNFLIASEDTFHTEIFTNLKDRLLIEDTEIPCARIFESVFSLEKLDKYKLPGELSYSYYQELFTAMRSNTISSYLKNRVLEKTSYGNVKALNAHIFEENILVAGQDSVVLYHSNFDQDEESQKMLDIVNEFSEKERYKNVKFFCINGDLNEIRSFSHDIKPILLLYSKRNLLSPKFYEGPPNKKAIKKFIKSKKDIKAQTMKDIMEGEDL